MVVPLVHRTSTLAIGMLLLSRLTMSISTVTASPVGDFVRPGQHLVDRPRLGLSNRMGGLIGSETKVDLRGPRL
jgi:hypothetical protein